MFCLYFVAALLATAPSLAIPAEVFERQASTCNRDNLLRCFTASPAVASPFCASYTPTVTVTASTTSTVITSTATVPVTVPATAFSTSTTTVIVTDLSLTTITIPVETTVTQTVTGAPQTTGSLLNKRQASAPGPACLTRDGTKSTSYPASRISSACSCLYSQSTTTVTPTVGAVTTSSPVVTVTVTQTVPATVTAVTSVTSTGIATSTTTTVVTSTVLPPPVIINYSLAVGPGASCTYNRYTDGFEADNSPNNNYALGISQCEGYCTARPDCKFFFYLRFDPARARGADYGFCFIDNLPYDPAFLQCGYPTQKYVGYNKN